MADSFRPGDPKVQRRLRRIATGHIDAVLAGLDDREVHEVRKRCKRLRALIRLVRPCFDAFDDENVVFRDAGRALAGARDAAALVEAFDRLVEGRDGFEDLRGRLVGQRDAAEGDDLGPVLAEVRRAFLAARGRAKRWSLSERGFDALEGGLRRTYRKGRHGLEIAERKRSGHALHEWRKRVKDHAAHARLLRRAWPAVLDATAAEAAALGEDLGDHHDLVVLESAMEREGGAAADDVAALARARRAEIEARIFERGARVFAERPSALVERWRSYWSA